MSNNFDYRDLSQTLGENVSDILEGNVDETIAKLKKIKEEYGGDAILDFDAGANNISVEVKKYKDIKRVVEARERAESSNNELKKMSKTKNRP